MCPEIGDCAGALHPWQRRMVRISSSWAVNGVVISHNIIDNWRLTIYDLRFTIYDWRLTIDDLRFTIESAILFFLKKASFAVVCNYGIHNHYTQFQLRLTTSRTPHASRLTIDDCCLPAGDWICVAPTELGCFYILNLKTCRPSGALMLHRDRWKQPFTEYRLQTAESW